MRNPVGSASTSLGRSIGKQLNLACLVKRIKPAHGFLDGLTNGQEPMVPKQGGLLVTKALGYVASFLLGENSTFPFKDDVILSNN